MTTHHSSLSVVQNWSFSWSVTVSSFMVGGADFSYIMKLWIQHFQNQRDTLTFFPVQLDFILTKKITKALKGTYEKNPLSRAWEHIFCYLKLLPTPTLREKMQHSLSMSFSGQVNFGVATSLSTSPCNIKFKSCCIHCIWEVGSKVVNLGQPVCFPFTTFPFCLYLIQILDTPEWERSASFAKCRTD